MSVFENATSLPELNLARAKAYADSDKKDWPLISAAYSERHRRLIEMERNTLHVALPVSKPRVTFYEMEDTVLDASYNKELNTLTIYTSKETRVRRGSNVIPGAINIAFVGGTHIEVSVDNN